MAGGHADSILQSRPKGAGEAIAQQVDIDTVRWIRPAAVLPEVVARDAVGALPSRVIRSTVGNVDDLRADVGVGV